ncbi:MAG TPA: potassium channel family protein [Acetobacteraceae bacterium]|jgi:voltage-gated potassium channel|nr:potassium channel family protein [Acetobacteraceae bacterium]
MTRPPVRVRDRERFVSLDRHWLRSVAFTLLLVGLIATAIGADWTSTISSIVTCAVGFGFFYLLFPGGAHFGMTVANFLAIYACVFEFFRDANFPAVPQPFALGAVAMPVLGFLICCVMRRRQVYAIIHARRIRELDHLPRVTSWFLGAVAVGAATFALPRLELDAPEQGIALLAAMAVVTLFVVVSVRDVVLVMIDIAMVFEGVAARLDRLVRPMMAFVTFYSLLVVVFACLYRIADLTARTPQFALHGSPARISFVDSLYYSVATITTLGFGDIAPTSFLVRALTGMEVVTGVLMLLFGFSEIMRSAGSEREARLRSERRPPPPPPHDSA